jgi:hypothetical protein
MLPQLRMVRIVDAIGGYHSGELSCQEAAGCWASANTISARSLVAVRVPGQSNTPQDLLAPATRDGSSSLPTKLLLIGTG